MIVPANRALEIRHRVDEAKIAEPGLEAGEICQASCTDKCLGTRWWAFESLEEFENVKFREWKEGEDTKGPGGGGRYLMGEVPDDLAFVVEKKKAEFEIGQVNSKS